MHRYGLILRPPSFGTMPHGWTLLERAKNGEPFTRPDLPIGTFQYGVVGFTEPRTSDDCDRYGFKPDGEQDRGEV